MLDYAANGVKYWPVAELRADFEAGCAARNEDPDLLIEAVSPGNDAEEFWKQVEQNLRSGHVRMVFVADRLPEELVRVIEFLNEQMSPAEVLGVEVQQFTDGDTRVLVPRRRCDGDCQGGQGANYRDRVERTLDACRC